MPTEDEDNPRSGLAKAYLAGEGFYEKQRLQREKEAKKKRAEEERVEREKLTEKIKKMVEEPLIEESSPNPEAVEEAKAYIRGLLEGIQKIAQNYEIIAKGQDVITKGQDVIVAYLKDLETALKEYFEHLDNRNQEIIKVFESFIGENKKNNAMIEKFIQAFQLVNEK